MCLQRWLFEFAGLKLDFVCTSKTLQPPDHTHSERDGQMSLTQTAAVPQRLKCFNDGHLKITR